MVYDPPAARKVAAEAIEEAAARKNDPADLINISQVHPGRGVVRPSTSSRACLIRSPRSSRRTCTPTPKARRCLSPRWRTTAETNKVESYNRFSSWCRFGNHGVIADNDPEEQEKIVKFSTLLTNAAIFAHLGVDLAETA